MTQNQKLGEVRMIAVEQIDFRSRRERSHKEIQDLVKNIRAMGLKNNITVTPRRSPDGTQRFLLLSGTQRFRGFILLGDAYIPAIVLNISDEKAVVLSLMESIHPINRVTNTGRLL
jgi:ParB family chromosome partitioning protein